MRGLLTIRWKFLYCLLASLAVTGVLLYAGDRLASSLINEAFFRWMFRYVINHAGSNVVLIVTGIPLFLILYYFFTRGLTARLVQLEAALLEVANGRMDVKLPVRAQDEIGQASSAVNWMTEQLHGYIEQISLGLGHIAEGRFDYRIGMEAGGGELARVADSINQMAEQLDKSIQEERLAEKTKNDLITGVSHDLRTPLTSVLGFLEVVENDRYQDEVELRHYVAIAYEKSLTLKKLIDDLFEFTRINNGMPLDRVNIDLIGFMRQLAEEFVPILEQSDMVSRLTTKLDQLVIAVDGDLLVRGFGNLITNAIRYGHEGKFVDIEIQETETEAVVTIANYGEPIPERDIPFLFERFYRGDRSRSSGGTGLGLSIVKSIIDVHGGHITVNSDRRRTAFEVRLPRILSN